MKKFLLYFFLLIITIPISLSVAYFLKASQKTETPLKQLVLERFIRQWDQRGTSLPDSIYRAIDAKLQALTYSCIIERWRAEMRFINREVPVPINFGTPIKLDGRRIICRQKSGTLTISTGSRTTVIVTRHTDFFQVEMLDANNTFELFGPKPLRLSYKSNVLEFTLNRPKEAVAFSSIGLPNETVFEAQAIKQASVSVKLLKRAPTGATALFLKGPHIVFEGRPIPENVSQQIL